MCHSMSQCAPVVHAVQQQPQGDCGDWCVAVSCSMLQCHQSVMRRAGTGVLPVCCSVMQCVAACCRVYQSVMWGSSSRMQIVEIGVRHL